MSQKHFHIQASLDFLEEYEWMSVNVDFIQRAKLKEGYIEFLTADGKWFKTLIPPVPGYLYEFALALNLKNMYHEPSPIH